MFDAYLYYDLIRQQHQEMIAEAEAFRVGRGLRRQRRRNKNEVKRARGQGR